MAKKECDQILNTTVKGEKAMKEKAEEEQKKKEEEEAKNAANDDDEEDDENMAEVDEVGLIA